MDGKVSHDGNSLGVQASLGNAKESHEEMALRTSEKGCNRDWTVGARESWGHNGKLTRGFWEHDVVWSLWKTVFQFLLH